MEKHGNKDHKSGKTPKAHHEYSGNIYIITDKDFYHPGDEVTGHVNIRATKPVSNC